MSDTIPEIDVLAVAKLQEENADFLLLDVREEAEYATASIEGSLLLPMSQLRLRFHELEPYRDQLIVVHCHHGMRSLQVAEALLENGFTNVQSMQGGIDDWSVSVDSSVPRY
jgi:rhodanese-related sulfurtransferase